MVKFAARKMEKETTTKEKEAKQYDQVHIHKFTDM